ncbi:MAG: dppA, partial [Microbacteriaceae bacterium]|nr:dppA [Microbacteriaceae bacterium]
SADVVWSTLRKFKATTSVIGLAMAPVITDPAQVTAVDKYTFAVKIPTANQGLSLLNLMGGSTWGIYDSTLLKAHATDADPYSVTWAAANPNIGFGAYEQTTYTPGQELVLTANKDYVLGEPKVKTITFRQVTDAGLRATALRSGDVDIAQQIQPADQTALSKEGFSIFDSQIASKILNVSFNTRSGPFTDINVRKAFSYAVPYDQIVKGIYAGRGTRTNGFLDPMPGYSDAKLPSFTYDPKKSLKILKDAGIATPVKFTVNLSSALSDVQDSAVQIKAMALAAGFDVTVNSMAAGDFSAATAAGKYDALMNRGGTNNRAPYYVLTYSVTGKFAWIPSAAYTADVAKGAAQDDGTSKAAVAAWTAAMTEYINNYPAVRIAIMPPFVVIRKGIDGYVVRPDVATDFSRLK